MELYFPFHSFIGFEQHFFFDSIQWKGWEFNVDQDNSTIKSTAEALKETVNFDTKPKLRSVFFTKGPNILFILIDDVGWADFGYNNQMATKFGAKENTDGQIPTPNIDRLAEKGLKLTSHYVHPTCTPSR